MNRVFLLVSVAVALAAAAAGVACADEPACVADTDCATLETCVDGACQRLEAPEVTGDCETDADCSAGEVCRDGECKAAATADACSFERDALCVDLGGICTVNRTTPCPGGEPCTLLFVCGAVVGEKKGGYACESDAECQSGVCVSGSCLRACVTDDGCPGSFVCRERQLDAEHRVRTCVGFEDGAEQDDKTMCKADRECTPPRVCRFGEPDAHFATGEPFGSCQLPAEDAVPFMHTCETSSQCAGGFCSYACQVGFAEVCANETADRCLQPCEVNSDCPVRFTCQADREEGFFEGERVYYCQLPNEGCFDDIDCCPWQDAEGCHGGWNHGEHRRCRLFQLGPDVVTKCQPDEGLALPGAPCAADAECASKLCVEPAGGGERFCTSPCHPEPSRDRCEEIFGAGVACQETLVEVEAQSVPIHICR